MDFKNAEFDADFKSVEKGVKKFLISMKVQKLCTFPPLSTVYKSS